MSLYVYMLTFVAARFGVCGLGLGGTLNPKP